MSKANKHGTTGRSMPVKGSSQVRWYLIILLPLVLSSCSTSKVNPPMTLTAIYTASPVKTPTDTPHSQPTFDISNKPLGKSTIVVIRWDGQGAYLMDLDNGTRRELEIHGVPPNIIYRWSNNGCSLIVGLNGRGLARIDLKGNILQELLPPNWYEGDGNPFALTISPNEEWIAYVVGRGNQDFHGYEIQEVETISLKNKVLYPLTTRGGAILPDWNSDGQWIAFTERDPNNVPQIYVSHPDGSQKQQISQFRDPDSKVIRIKWSPDGSKIAFVIGEPNNTLALGFVSIENASYYTKVLAKEINSIGSIWWENLFIVAEMNTSPSKTADWGVFWIDTETGSIANQLYQSETPQLSLHSPGPIGKDWHIGFFSDSGTFYIYDVTNKEVEKIWNTNLGGEWLTVPKTFLGEAACVYP